MVENMFWKNQTTIQQWTITVHPQLGSMEARYVQLGDVDAIEAIPWLLGGVDEAIPRESCGK